MKRIAITVGAVALCLVPVTVAAQAPGARTPASAASRPMRLGFAIGLNRTTVDGAEVVDEVVNSRLGAVTSVSLNYAVSDIIALQPEIAYAMKGAQLDFGDFLAPATIALDYLAIPLLVQARIPTSGQATPFILGGPSVGFLLRARLQDGDQSENIDDQIEDVDLGVVIGGGVEIATARGALALAIRYEIGVTDVSDDPNDGDVNNRALSIGLGFLF